MPPKRAKLTLPENGEEDGEGLEALQIGNKKKATAKAKEKHAAYVIALDVGSTSGFQSVPDEKETDLQRSVQIVDWLISRKLFTESTDRFSHIFFGHESTSNNKYPNVYVHNTDFERARVEWLHMFKEEVQTNPKTPGNYLTAFNVALETIKVHAENLDKGELTDASIMLISNFDGLDDEKKVMNAVQTIADKIKSIGVKVFIIGPDLWEEPKSKTQKIGYNFVRQLLAKVDEGLCLNFREGLSKLSFFIPKAISPRGQPFNLELGADFSVRVQMYVKNQEQTLKLSFNPVSSADKEGNVQELRKVRKYETVATEGQPVSFTSIDQAPDDAFEGQSIGIPTGRFVEKEDIVKGYRYGSTIVQFDRDTQNLADLPREGKQLKLIQFFPKENILPQFIMSSPRYILPHKDAKSYDKAAFETLSALVQAMIEQNVVALCRYSYNINSNPRLVCLIPKMTKEENYPVLIHYVMPFRDDFRYYDFPPLSTEEMDQQQLDQIGDYVDSMMLCSDDGQNEHLKKRDIHDPRIQFQCMVLREKALGKSGEISAEDKRGLLETLSPPKQNMARTRKILEDAKDMFKLELNEKTKMAAFAKPKITSKLISVDDNLQPILATLIDGKQQQPIEEKYGMEDDDLKKMEH